FFFVTHITSEEAAILAFHSQVSNTFLNFLFQTFQSEI
ncbi:hypothetical protein VIOR3934_07136, partial [Vibrio orientalis CIP 102891 = ATCC 33934]